jgi:CheY-like chemotaxis protein
LVPLVAQDRPARFVNSPVACRCHFTHFQNRTMTVDQAVELIDSVTKLVSALAWPVLVGLVVSRFAPALRLFFENIGEFSLKGAGFEASAKRRQAEAAAALAAAAAARPESDASPQRTAKNAREAIEVVAEMVTPAILRRASKATILWVDDYPENNVYEMQSLEALGISCVLAKSTEEALDKLKAQRFDVIISDMGRPPDSMAGYTLIDLLRKSGDPTPIIIYSGSNAPEHRAEARKRGAVGATNRAAELFELVMFALRGLTQR